jgi:hypothetical protein
MNFVAGEIITSTVNDIVQTVTLSAASEEYNSVHHYENSEGKYVDVDPSVGNAALFTEVTFLDRYIASNDELKTIKVIKPNSLNGIISAFNDALRS